jgi:hypothetical protein
MTDDLRTTLRRIADSTEPLPVPGDLWQRAQSARRARVLAVAATLAVLVSLGGVATLWTLPDRAARTASSQLGQGGAIPSRIEDPDGLRATDDLAVGRASVAFIGKSSDVVVVTAVDGRYHALALPEAPLTGPVRLSPDGTMLAYAYQLPSQVRDDALESGSAIVDLVSGAVRRIPAIDSTFGAPVAVSTFGWSADSSQLAWWGRTLRASSDAAGERGTHGAIGLVNARTGDQTAQRGAGSGARTAAISVNDSGWLTLVTEKRAEGWVLEPDYDGGGGSSGPLASDLPGGDPGTTASRQPTGVLTVVGATRPTGAVPFVTERGEVLERRLDRELYPTGATQVTPLGWATDSLVLAEVDGPTGSYVEGRHLALLTSPDRPRSEWTYRLVMRQVPDVAQLSVAVDLVPDLDGTSSQQLTHDFGDVSASDRRDISWIIGLGVAAAISLLGGSRWLWRRLSWT